MTAQQAQAQSPGDDRVRSPFAVGITVTAAILLIVIGLFHFLQGLVAVVNDTFYVVGEEYVFEFDLTTWGWIHMVLGVIVVVAGFFVFRGAVWARVIGVTVAVLSAVLNFMWLPYYPLWSILIIALDVLVIWALTAHGRDVTR